MKLDRQGIVATVVALREWMNMDMEAYLQMQARRVAVISGALVGLPHIKTEIMRYPTYPAVVLRIMVDEPGLGKTAAAVTAELKESEPGIAVHAYSEKDVAPHAYSRRDAATVFIINVQTVFMRDGDVEVVARRLREVLSR